ncbi:hypothetical protein PC119_g20395 [Phytophthora cactorum]|nr:hypothetical protein PC111_g17575 [Phytophthora cactorum]KAG2984516.1 hypothetical protein PC119_g20395 [Phytophthora cactorum]KAG2991701.1 hypothetical protein PC120_g22646 [Phytophthora cactorum]KAG3179285.1 hypothetical protein C6341_g7542 [Phytophthora cactorum]
MMTPQWSESQMPVSTDTPRTYFQSLVLTYHLSSLEEDLVAPGPACLAFPAVGAPSVLSRGANPVSRDASSFDSSSISQSSTSSVTLSVVSGTAVRLLCARPQMDFRELDASFAMSSEFSILAGLGLPSRPRPLASPSLYL